MTQAKFYICRHCGNIVAMVHDSGVPLICCGEKMQELTPNTTEAAHEKHLPVITTAQNLVTVAVGSAAHPMVQEHFIQWICLETNLGRQRKALEPGQAPQASFALVEGEQPLAAYAYCNLHGLWKTEL